jgi:hypothetical protein
LHFQDYFRRCHRTGNRLRSTWNDRLARTETDLITSSRFLDSRTIPNARLTLFLPAIDVTAIFQRPDRVGFGAAKNSETNSLQASSRAGDKGCAFDSCKVGRTLACFSRVAEGCICTMPPPLPALYHILERCALNLDGRDDEGNLHDTHSFDEPLFPYL